MSRTSERVRVAGKLYKVKRKKHRDEPRLKKTTHVTLGSTG